MLPSHRAHIYMELKPFKANDTGINWHLKDVTKGVRVVGEQVLVKRGGGFTVEAANIRTNFELVADIT